MSKHELERVSSAERIAHDVGRVEFQLRQEGSDVFGHELIPHGAIDVHGSSVTLQLDSDDTSRLREHGEVRSEHGDAANAAVQEDERGRVGRRESVELVVQLESV